MPNPVPDPTRLAELATLLQGGGVIAYPTEAVFGLGCDPANAASCQRIIDLKGRDGAKGMIVITDTLERIAQWLAPLPADRHAQIMASWPGPHTWLWPALPACPAWLRGEHATLAVRVTAHAGTRALCAHAGMALVSTSANRSGAPPCRDAACVHATFAGTLDGILDAPCGDQTQPSSIRDALTGVWYRGGPGND